MKAVFLCGGIGKRMLPFTEDKFLFDFLGKTLLEHQLEIASEAGLKQFVVIANSSNFKDIEQITQNYPDLKIDLTIQHQPLGIANALKSAKTHLNGTIIIVNPNDVFSTTAYSALLSEANDNDIDSYMLGYEVNEHFPGGYLDINDDSLLKHIIEKPKPGKEPSNLVNILLHLHHQPEKILTYADRIKTKQDDVYEKSLDTMIREGCKIRVIPYKDFWTPIKYPWHILDVARHFLKTSKSSVSKTALIATSATIEGNVTIGDGVRIFENAVIRGPAYIGPNTIIGNNVLIRDHSHIGANCVIGFSTEIKGSYIGDYCWFHSNYIGDCIIGNNCSFGAGTVLANFRFDEHNISVQIGNEFVKTGRDKLGAIIGNNCKTGINASIMPGTKIGPNSVVGSQVYLTKDLGPGKMALNQPQCHIMPNKITPDESSKTGLKQKLTEN